MINGETVCIEQEKKFVIYCFVVFSMEKKIVVSIKGVRMDIRIYLFMSPVVFLTWEAVTNAKNCLRKSLYINIKMLEAALC